jgi:hypothetical protein
MSKDNDEIEIDMAMITAKIKTTSSKAVQFLKNNQYVLPIILLIIAIFFSVHFRMYPSNLPITDQWAESTIYNSYRSDITNQINQQYPNLPDSHKERLINEEFNKFLKENGAQINPLIEQYSNQFKSHFQNEDGNTFLLAIDPYLWYRYGLNYLECKHPGCYEIENESGTYYATLRDGRNYQVPRMAGVAYLGVFIYHFMNIFKETSLMRAFFFVSIVLVALSIIPAFFLAKRLGGNLGGFVAGLIIAINAPLLGRTPGGFTDNDGAIILFPLFAIWCLVGFIEAKSWHKRILFGTGGGLVFYLMSRIWPTQHLFFALLCSVIMYIGLLGLIDYIKHKKLSSVYDKIKQVILMPFLFLVSCLVVLTVFVDFRYIISLFEPILNFVRFHEVAVRTAWPNVLTTVAELNVRPYSSLVDSMGGNLIIGISLIGLVLLFLIKSKDKKSNLLFASAILVWTVATVFSYSRGLRFAILVVPSLAICFGTALGLMYQYGSKWFTKELHLNHTLSKSLFCFIILLLFILPVTPTGSLFTSARDVSMNQIPSYNTAWDNTLNSIKSDAEDGYGYITTWWDFGHWFVAKGIRVTFDGGDQGRRIHWVGNSLLTDDEHLSVSILRMLNCGQENSFNLLEDYFENDTLKAVTLTYETIVEDKDKAREILERENVDSDIINQFLDYTHCDDEILFPHYFITSEDMVGKAGVWGHFGSWNFTKSTIWQTIRGTSFENGTDLLVKRFNISIEEAPNMYYEIQRTNADQWVSPWPGYLSERANCMDVDDLLRCENGVEINLTNMKSYLYTQQGKMLLSSLSYINHDNEFSVIEYEGDTLPYSLLLLPNKATILAHPLHAGSMFTRLFFYEGHGLKHFKQFSDVKQITGARILTWKIDWDSTEPINIFHLKELNESDENVLEQVIDVDELGIDLEHVTSDDDLEENNHNAISSEE